MTERLSRSRIDLTAEPFRLFFPAGTLAGILAVLLWPLFYANLLPFHPGIAHARLIVEGFFGAFVVGFLATSIPRLLGVAVLRSWELTVLGLLWISSALLQSFSLPAPGDAAFAMMITALGLFLAARWPSRKDTPPPGFILVDIGCLCGIAGSLLFALLFWPGNAIALPPSTPLLANLLLYQGFLLCPLLGIGAFMFPRFGGLESPHMFQESRQLPRGWLPKAVTAGTCGILIVASFVLEASGSKLWGGVLRTVTVAAYLVTEVPLGFRKGKTGTAGRIIQIAMVMLALGLLSATIWPTYRLALLHILFIGGFHLALTAVATRILFGHSGQQHRVSGKVRTLRWVLWLLLLTLATRVSADFLGDHYSSHLVYASLAWLLALGIWMAFALPKAAVPDPDEE